MPRNPRSRSQPASRRPLGVALAFALSLPLLAGAASAQFPGQDLPPEAVKGMQANITRHQDMKQMADVDEIRKTYDDAQLRAFVEHSMAKLTLHPDGSFDAYAKPGGEFVAFKLGGKRFAVASQTEPEASWLTASGAFDVPRRARRVRLTLEAGGREIPVDCAGEFTAGEEPMTFWVGDLRGLTCLGFPGTEEPVTSEPAKTATLAAADSSPSSED